MMMLFTLVHNISKRFERHEFTLKDRNLLWQLNLNVTCQYLFLLQNFIYQVQVSGIFLKTLSLLLLISNQQCACLRPRYHRPGGTSMTACGNIIKEGQDFSTVESRKSLLIPFPISCRIPFVCVSSCQRILNDDWSVYRQNKWLQNY